MKKNLKFLVSLCAGLLLGANVWATPFNSLYVFGDSLSDAGSNPAAVLSIYKLLGNACDPFHPCPPYVDGHYSNGPIAAEYLANAILPGGGNPANFFSFAVSGATSGIGNFGDGGTASTAGQYGLPGMYQELGLYMALSGGVADPNALYFVWGGANDFLTLDSPFNAAQNIAGYVGALAGMGATHILVPNLPDLSLTPFVEDAGLVTVGHAFSLAFNTLLATLLDNLNSQVPTTDIIQFDTFSFFNDIVANPGNFGFTDAQHACLSTLSCIPGDFVFWDGFHPTTQADTVIASAFANAVPEPGSIPLLAIGLLTLLAVNQGRRMGQAGMGV